jgi:hypothetical protein
MQTMISSRHSPLANHPGVPADPQDTRKAATTARINMVTARESICCQNYGLKHASQLLTM